MRPIAWCRSGSSTSRPDPTGDWISSRRRTFSTGASSRPRSPGLAAVGYSSISVKAEHGQEPETLETQAVTADFFPVLGTRPIIGRTFTADNEVNGRARVAVISYGLWQRRFGGAPDVIGRPLPGQRGDFEILGVMPPSFAYPVGAIRPTEVWIPNVFRADERVRANEYSYRLQVIGRLRDGTSLEQAQAQMNQITARLAAETPRWFEDRVARVAAASRVSDAGRPHLDAHAPRSGGLRPAHRVREPGHADAGPAQRAQPRARHPVGDRRLALGSRPGPARGKPSPVARRGRARRVRRVAGRGGASVRHPGGRAACRGHRRRSARARHDRRGGDCERPAVQRGARPPVLACAGRRGRDATSCARTRRTRPTSGCAERSSPSRSRSPSSCSSGRDCSWRALRA